MKVTNTRLAVIAISIASIDQLTKYAARSQGIAQLNQGGVLGLSPAWNWEMLSLIVLIGLSIYLATKTKLNPGEKLGWVIILASGYSNLVDRLFYSGVWDWIYYPVIRVVGNLADILLGVGIVVVVWAGLSQTKKKPNKPNDSN